MKKILKEVIQNLDNDFTTNKHNNVVLLDGAEQSTRDMVYAAHEEALGHKPLPDNFVYRTISLILEEFSYIEDPEELVDAFIEPDIHDYALIEWISSHRARDCYVNEVIENLSNSKASDSPTFYQLLRTAQFAEIEGIKQVVINHVEELYKAAIEEQKNEWEAE